MLHTTQKTFTRTVRLDKAKPDINNSDESFAQMVSRLVNVCTLNATYPAQEREFASAYLTPVSISALRAVFASSKRFVSYSFNFPIGRTFLMPFGPKTTFCAKYGKSVTSDLQYAHSTGDRPVSPARTAL